ncbi:UNVERIFIED_CONTAM: hypothetical protein FKN15_005576 [Acipenser sinensis]
MNTRCPPKRVPSAARFFTHCELTVQPPQSYSVGGQRISGQLTGKPAGARPDYRGRWCAVPCGMPVCSWLQRPTPHLVRGQHLICQGTIFYLSFPDSSYFPSPREAPLPRLSFALRGASAKSEPFYVFSDPRGFSLRPSPVPCKSGSLVGDLFLS